MRLVLNGNINRTYVQTLCMMFFHGEKFPLNEIDGDKSLKVSVKETEKGIYCDCEMTYNGKSASSSTFAEFNGNKRERTSKIAIGRAVYLVGKQITGRGVDWGILTGIRPSKVAYELYAQHGYDRAREILCNDYLLNEKKASLALDVAINEHSILDNYNSNCCSVYISIPFCPTRCAYCSYVSYATKKLFDLIPEYLSASDFFVLERG